MKKLNAAYEEIMTALYQNSEPSADFKLLVEQAPIGEHGRKVIDFESYEIEREKAEAIFDSVVKKYKIKTKWDLDTLGFNVWLGASPRSKAKSNQTQIQTS